MAKINGTDIIIKLDDDKVLHTTNGTLSINQDLPDATTKDSGGWADHIAGLRDYSVTIEGYAVYSASTGNVVDLVDLVLDRETADFEFTTDKGGDVKFTGTVSLANLELSSEMEQTAGLSSTLTGKGPLVKAVISS
jgi:predicted secreted protein